MCFKQQLLLFEKKNNEFRALERRAKPFWQQFSNKCVSIKQDMGKCNCMIKRP